MFEDATFHSRGILPSKTPQWMLLTFTINLIAVTALIILPLIYPEGLPGRMLSRVLYTPTPPPAAISHPITSQPATPHLESIPNPMQAPTIIPRDPKIDSEPQPSAQGPIDLTQANSSSVTGSTAPSLFKPSTPPLAVKPATPKSLTISSGVATGLLLTHPTPTYPAIAKAAGVSGTVVLAATISKSGAIQNLRVLSGNPMLQQAAITAVQQWQYRPYMLNNQPIEVDTTINIVFSLGNH